MAFALAMNITGSFEGHKGWDNISNNFDGQGVSLGILNQNLGQGTLQPLFIDLRDNHYAVLQNAMTKTMLTSLLDMLKKWETAQLFEQKSSVQPDDFSQWDEQALVESSTVLEDVDKLYRVTAAPTRSNSASVTWAKKTLYSDSKHLKFKPEWKEALTAIAVDPEYITLQIAAAHDMHDRTQEYRARLEWPEIRSYLLLFDFVVQNGGLAQKHFDKFADWRTNNPGAPFEKQMLQMLEIRVVDSHPAWQADVRARKTAVITGSGLVHGEHRNLPLEYCYDPLVFYAYPPLPPPPVEPPVGTTQVQFASP